MSVVIDWGAFLLVFAAALTGAAVVVFFYALGLRLLVRGGRAPVVTPATFTDAIAVITPKEAQRAARLAEKAARKSPLTDGQKLLARVGAYVCFGLCSLAVLGGILLITLHF